MKQDSSITTVTTVLENIDVYGYIYKTKATKRKVMLINHEHAYSLGGNISTPCDQQRSNIQNI